MIYFEKVPWKNTIAFRISFDLRGLGIHENHEGLLHFAEHLMFVETEKYSPMQLHEKYELIFDVIHAQTSRDFLTINVVCSTVDLAEVCTILEDMLYTWKCNKDQFLYEQKGILEELRGFENGWFYRMSRPLAQQISVPVLDIIGTKKRISSLKFSDVKEMHGLWRTVMDQAPRDLFVASSRLTTEQAKILKKLALNTKKTNIKSVPPVYSPAQFISLPHIDAVLVTTPSSSPFFMLLQRLYYMRWVRLNPYWMYTFNSKDSNILFTAHKSCEVELDKKESKIFLLAQPSKDEFIMARNIVLKHLNSMSDGVKPEEIIDWVYTFNTHHIPELQGKTLSQIKDIFRKITYVSFLKHWKQVFGNFAEVK